MISGRLTTPRISHQSLPPTSMKRYSFPNGVTLHSSMPFLVPIFLPRVAFTPLSVWKKSPHILGPGQASLSDVPGSVPCPPPPPQMCGACRLHLCATTEPWGDVIVSILHAAWSFVLMAPSPSSLKVY